MNRTHKSTEIITEIDELIAEAGDTIFLLEEYSSVFMSSKVSMMVKKYIKSMNRIILRWNKTKEEIDERGVENAGDLSYMSLKYKIDLGYKQIGLSNDEFKEELKREGLEEDYNRFLVVFKVLSQENEECISGGKDTALYSEIEYLRPFIDKAKRGKTYRLPDTVNLQLRRELKVLEKQYEELQNLLYKRLVGEDTDNTESEDFGEYIRIKNGIEVRRLVLEGNRR